VTNGGSNLSYGIRSLYSRLFGVFDEWLANGCKFPAVRDTGKSTEGDADASDAMAADPEAQEAAAILESLMGTAGEPGLGDASSGKRKKVSEDNNVPKKVRSLSIAHVYARTETARTPLNFFRVKLTGMSWLFRSFRSNTEQSCN
jgi:hypothetical protein